MILAGRRALVTGSARGIGRAIALGFAGAGAHVAVHYATHAAPAAEVAAQAARLAGHSHLCAGDLSIAGVAREIVEDATAGLGGPLDIVVANAAIQVRGRWDMLDPEDSRSQIQANLLSTIELFQSATPEMKDRKWGRLLAIGSIQQRSPHPEMLVYAATKSGILNVVRNLARQLAPSGITVNNLALGAILTDRNSDVLGVPAYREATLARIPMGRIGAAQDCVGAAIFLCSDAAAYVTGADLPVDGGMHL